MKRTLGRFLAAAVICAAGALTSVAVPAQSASAQSVSPPTGGCPPKWELMEEDAAVSLAPEENEAKIRGTDRNGDDWLCVKFSKDGSAFTYTDNNRPL